jgi:hypothetical protein
MPNNPWTGPMPFQPPSAYQPAQGGGLPSSYFGPNASAPGSQPWSATQQPNQAGLQANQQVEQERMRLYQQMYPGAPAPMTSNPASGSIQRAGTQQQPQAAPLAAAPGPSAPGQTTGTPGAGPPINLNGIPPMYLPTRQSQNMLMAQAAQKANPGNALNRLVGNTGIQSSSGVLLSQLGKPMIDAYQQGALGAANLGIDDQLLRDQHTTRGVLGNGQADIGAQRALLNRERIGIDGQNQLSGSLANILKALGGAFNTNSLLGSAGSIGGLF